MLEQAARVVAVRRSGVEVCARPSAACLRCAAGRGCGGGVIGALMAREQATLIARPGRDPVGVGDTVTLKLPASALLEAAALAYLTPLAAMFLALGLAGLVAWPLNDAAMAAVGGGGLLVGVAGTKLALRRIGPRRWQPVAVARRDSDNDGGAPA